MILIPKRRNGGMEFVLDRVEPNESSGQRRETYFEGCRQGYGRPGALYGGSFSVKQVCVGREKNSSALDGQGPKVATPFTEICSGDAKTWRWGTLKYPGLQGISPGHKMSMSYGAETSGPRVRTLF